jgi:hypothetical protein
MKKHRILYISLPILLLILSSCNKFLDLAPVSEIGENGFYTNQSEMEAGVIAIYDGLQAIPETEFAVTELRSDNGRTKTMEGSWAQFENMNVEPTNATVAEYWSSNYNTIFRANTVLDKLGNLEDGSAKTQYEGEAKFARALCHFNLVRAFGDVPIIDKVIGPQDKDYFARNPKSEVYDFIVSDLKDAIDKLPTRSGIAEGRATKGAAQTLLAKVYLELGDYASAKTLLDAVVASNDYGLMANYHDIFYSELNKEVIFAIQYINDNVNDSENFSYSMTWAGRAGGLNFPTMDLISLVYPDAVNGTSAVEVDPATVPDKRFGTLFYFEPKAGNRYECGKWRTDAASPENGGGTDWVVLRYGDVLLMRAEAIMAGSNSTTDPTALSDFNAIRTRAGLGTVTTLTKEMLLNERRIEMAFEDSRLYDLVRFGVADQVMSDYATLPTGDAGVNYKFTPTDLLLPIPQREMNLYDGMVQNPGY